MGYRVFYLLKNTMTYEDYENATHVRVTQNHLHVYQDEDCLAVYQSGWWIKAVKIKEE